MATEEEVKEAAKREMFRRMAAAEKARRVAASHPSYEEGMRLMERDRMAGPSGTVGAALTGAVNGVPIVGPYLLGGAQKAAAGLSRAISGGSYDDNLDAAKRITQEAGDAHPYVRTGGEVTGAVGGMLPAIMTAPAVFGGGAGGLLGRTGMSAVSGGAIGGTDAAVRSDGDPTATAWGAGAGLTMGAAGSTIGKAVGEGARSVMDALRNRGAARAAGIEPEALTFLRRAVKDDGFDAAAVDTRLAEMGPDAMLADIGPNLQKQAGALAATPGRNQAIIMDALKARQGGANSRINTALDDNLVPSVVPSEIERGIQANQRAHGPQYGDSFRQATPYDITPITDDLDLRIGQLRGGAQTNLQRVRGMLNVHNTNQVSSDPNVMFQTRQAIDGMLATEADPKVIAALTETRQHLDDALTRAVPRIKEADASFAELGRQNTALSRGQTVLDSGRTAPRPSELAAEVQNGALPQGMQIGPSAVPLRLAQGARAEIDRIVGTKANDVVAMNSIIKGEGDWNRSRLATLFGEEKADRLFDVLANERAFADTANTVTRNSETAARQAAQAELGGAGVGEFGVKDAFKAGGFSGAARAAALDKIESVARALVPSSGPKARESLARTLVEQRRDAVVRALTATAGIGRTPEMIDPVVKALLLGGGTTGAR